MSAKVYTGDALAVMRELGECSIDAVVTDPPYGIGFMGHEWDQPGLAGATKPNGRPGTKRADGKEISGGSMEAGRYDLSPTANQRFQAWCEGWAREVYRVLKPGGHMLVFGGTRTFHRLTCGLEDAGFEIRDSILSGGEEVPLLAWLYGSGFPKSLNVSKAMDKRRDDSQPRGDVAEWLRPYVERFGFDRLTEHFGFKGETMARARWTTRSGTKTPTLEQWAELKRVLELPDDMDAEVWRLNGRKGQPGEDWWKREVVRERTAVQGGGTSLHLREGERREVNADITAPASDAAREWEGWGTALKPSWEPIVVARKPLDGTVAANVVEHGTGAINVDGCRIASADENPSIARRRGATSHLAHGRKAAETEAEGRLVSRQSPETYSRERRGEKLGRWPSNVALAHTEDCVLVGGETTELWACVPRCPVRMLDDQSGMLTSGANPTRRNSDKFLTAYGEFEGQRECEPARGAERGGASRFFYCAKASSAERNAGLDGRANVHPTVKPIDLMRWLLRMVTPPGGLLLDPFAGSGTTLCAAVLEGFDCIGIERDPVYVEIIDARVAFWGCQDGALSVRQILGDARRRRPRRAPDAQLSWELS